MLYKNMFFRFLFAPLIKLTKNSVNFLLYFLHSITKNKSLDNTIQVAKQLEAQGVIKKGLAKAISDHKHKRNHSVCMF